jgi:hypothetical protein
VTASIQSIMHEDDTKIVLYVKASAEFGIRTQDRVLYAPSVLGLQISAKADPSDYLSGFG